jgi:hypothetical protein
LTSDPYEASGGAGEPGSWGRGVYVGGDSVNFLDRTGLASCPAGSSTCVDVHDTANPVCYVGGSPVFSQEMCNLANTMPGTSDSSTGMTWAPNGGEVWVQGLRWRNVTSGTKNTKVTDTLRHIRSSLTTQDSTCANWLFGNASRVVGPSFTVAMMSNTISAEGLGVVVGDGPALAQLNNGAAQTVGGTSVNILLSNTLLNGGAGELRSISDSSVTALLDPAGQAYLIFVLLHEMAHLYRTPGFQSDDGPSSPGGNARQISNNDLVWKNCKNTILQAPGFGNVY